MSGLKSVFETMKRDTGENVLPRIDQYLLSLNNKPNDRAINVNAPSVAGSCLRSIYYYRIQAEKDPNAIEPRAFRIFQNGDYVHDRIQAYLRKAGLLLMDELPLRNDKYNIQGHTDGLLFLNRVKVFELKSINDAGFQALKEPEFKHQQQGMLYIFCVESRRNFLQSTYSSYKEFQLSLPERVEYYASLYKHLRDGAKYTKEQKLKFKIDEHIEADEILFHTETPIDEVVFLYENKNDQHIKEFNVKVDDNVLQPILDRCTYLNKCIAKKKVPDREGKSKNVAPCKWCNYKIECWN